MNARMNELAVIWRDNKLFYRILGGAALVIVGVWLGSLLYGGGGMLAPNPGYASNVYTEVLSVLATIAVLDFLARRRDASRMEETLKTRLVRELASPDNVTAVNAARGLRANRWLNDGTLRGAQLSYANLNSADLVSGDFRAANMVEAKLQWAHLYHAKLQDANLFKAVLAGANLQYANLDGADLDGADLKGALMENAYLRGANLDNVTFDAQTVLPDARPWTPETDMRRFTDPHHPRFFQPGWVKGR